MSVEEEGAEFILQKAETNQSPNIPEGIEPDLTGSGQAGRIEPSLAWLIEQRSCLVSKAGTTKFQLQLVLGVPHRHRGGCQCVVDGCLRGQDGGGGE